MSNKSSFNKTQYTVMALGNIIGSGIFLASSSVINIAGVYAPIAYLLGGLIMMMEVAFLIEMSIANPVSGAFKVHAQEIFGKWWGFVVGWNFWTGGVLGMASEVIACSIFMRLWFPSVPLWVFSLFFSVIITAINLIDLKGLSKIEIGLSSIKIVTLIIFVLIGFIIALGIPIGSVTENFAQFKGIVTQPLQGIKGLLGSMLLLLFAYTGTGIIGLAAVETENAAETVPPATKVITFTVVGLYVLCVTLIIAILPGKLDVNISPFTRLFELLNIPYAASVVNFILVTAGLSALNSQVYSTSRMLFSLAKHQQAPQFAAYENKKGVPVYAVLLDGAFLMLIVLASYILPQKIFIYLIGASGFLALVNWMSASATHYFYRKKILKENPQKLKYKAPFYPYLSWICFVSIFLVILTTPFYPDQLPGLYTGIVVMIVIGLAYFLVPKNKILGD